MSVVSLENIGVSYDKKNFILRNLSLTIEDGELVSLLGPSGCGKTTTLRVIAGLLDPTEGVFHLDESDMTKVPVHKRNFGMVFQSYALFPHLTIRDNIAFGLKQKKLSKEVIEEKIAKIVEICDLKGLEDRFPKQLSGGQRQRVALARALVVEPKLLLLDEPLSNLDAKLRLSMRLEIKRIQQQLGITTVFVTHDQEECFSISDRVAIMNNGVIEQYDRPEEIYRYPKTKFVASFIGFENFISVKKGTDGYFQDETGQIFDALEREPRSESTELCLTIRPEDIQLKPLMEQATRDKNELSGIIQVRTFLGKSYQYEVLTESGKLLVTSADAQVLEVGESVRLSLPSEKLIVLTN